MTKQELYEFIRSKDLAVLATVSESNAPEAALVGIAVTPDLELIFDTLKQSRKYQNLVRNPHIAVVIGWDNEITLQYEGKAEEPQGADLERVKSVYFEKWPACREHEKWEGITYVRILPKWIRFSDYNKPADQSVEFTF